MTPGRRKLTDALILLLLVLVALQVVLLFVNWISWGKSGLQLVAVGGQLMCGLLYLVTRRQKRGGSKAAPPVDNSPEK